MNNLWKCLLVIDIIGVIGLVVFLILAGPEIWRNFWSMRKWKKENEKDSTNLPLSY